MLYTLVPTASRLRVGGRWRRYVDALEAVCLLTDLPWEAEKARREVVCADATVTHAYTLIQWTPVTVPSHLRARLLFKFSVPGCGTYLRLLLIKGGSYCCWASLEFFSYCINLSSSHQGSHPYHLWSYTKEWVQEWEDDNEMSVTTRECKRITLKEKVQVDLLLQSSSHFQVMPWTCGRFRILVCCPSWPCLRTCPCASAQASPG